MKERLRIFNEHLGMWDLNSNIDYNEPHIGCIKEYDENNYKLLIEVYDEKLDEYIYSEYTEIIDKKTVEDGLKKVVCLENGVEVFNRNEYYEFYDEIENMINWEKADKDFEIERV